VDIKPADEFPSDDVGYGFDNIGDVLSFQPILLEKYMAAADKVLEAALAIPSAPKVSRQTYRPQNINTIPRTAKSRDPVRIVFTSEGSAYLERFHFPAEGEYVIRFRGWGSQVGNEFPKVAVRVDGRDIGQYTVDAPQGKAKVYETRTRLPAGEKRVAIAFTNAFTDPSTNQSRSFGLELLEIEGPFQPKLPPPLKGGRAAGVAGMPSSGGSGGMIPPGSGSPDDAPWEGGTGGISLPNPPIGTGGGIGLPPPPVGTGGGVAGGGILPPGGTPGANQPALAGGTGRTRHEFVVMFVWREPVPPVPEDTP
jgi:hypothetical protein